MKINSIKSSNYIYPSPQSSIQSFEGSRNYIHIGRSYLDKIGEEVTPKTVEELPTLSKILLRFYTPKRVKELAQMNCYAAEKVKGYFDSVYGKDNYTLISIGRSVASIAETMKHMGADVRVIPLSGLGELLPIKIPDKAIYKEYLDKIGINKEVINKNKDRKYILMDYVCTGESLENAEYFIKREILNSDPKNLIKVSVNQALGDEFNNKFAFLFSLSRFKEFSPVGKLSLLDLKRCFSQANFSTSVEGKSNMANYLRKIFLFNVFDNLKNGSFDNRCKKEMQAIEKHYLTPRVMAKLFQRIYMDDCG